MNASDVATSGARVQEADRIVACGQGLTAYKLVVVNRRDATSWCSVSAMGQSQVIYRLDAPAVAPDWLQAQGYHLLVFATLADAARGWRQCLSGKENAVFEAEVEGEVPLPPSATAWSLANGGTLEMLAPRYRGWPEGTRMVRQVTLRRRLTEEVLGAG